MRLMGFTAAFVNVLHKLLFFFRSPEKLRSPASLHARPHNITHIKRAGGAGDRARAGSEPGWPPACSGQRKSRGDPLFLKSSGLVSGLSDSHLAQAGEFQGCEMVRVAGACFVHEESVYRFVGLR